MADPVNQIEGDQGNRGTDPDQLFVQAWEAGEAMGLSGLLRMRQIRRAGFAVARPPGGTGADAERNR